MSKYVIIHGQLREVSDDELMHWKYIKRVKKNGRWVYYYDEKAANQKLYAQQQVVADAKANESAAKQKYDAAKQAADAKGLNDGRQTFTGMQMAIKNEQARTSTRYNSAKKKTEAAVKKYSQMKVSKGIEKAVSKGAAKVANFFSGIFKKR